jgi:hypothetical protein
MTTTTSFIVGAVLGTGLVGIFVGCFIFWAIGRAKKDVYEAGLKYNTRTIELMEERNEIDGQIRSELFAIVQAISIHGSNPIQLNQGDLFKALGLAMEKIEAAGASVALTEAVTIVGDVRSAIGNQWNPAQATAAERVRKLFKS